MLKKRCLSICLIVLSIVILTLSTAQTNLHVIAASLPSKTLTRYIPSAVTTGQAHLIGPHAGADQLALAIGLPLRNAQALSQLLNQVSTPHDPRYRHYLNLAQENEAFNPTAQQEQQVISWLMSHNLTVTHTYPNHLLVDVTGTFAQIEEAFHVTINDYTLQTDGKPITFYAPANEPTVDGSVSNVIETILGLDDFPSFQVDAFPSASTLPVTNGTAHNLPPYYPQDFANAYDVNPVWKAGYTGVGQHIGIVLSGPAPSDATLVQFHQATGVKIATRAKTYGSWLQVIPIDKGPYISSKLQAEEAGTDVESSSGMAPGATIDYYEAPTDKKGNPTSQGLEDALNRAGSDANNNAQISDSWHWECEPAQEDAFIQATEQILLSNSATGHNYFFSSGDSGSQCGSNNPLAQYPATSAYVTSVGGTHFSKNINGRYRQETAWSGSGGGYSILFSEPSWQTNAGIPDPNTMRGMPDVAADADNYTGAYICYDSSNGPTCVTINNPKTYIGGTSLATPLWAGMIADVNQAVESQNEPPLGFINPLLYEIAFSDADRGTAYHDIKEGTNGKYPAGPGWDAVTGWGSPDLYKLAKVASNFEANPGYLFSVAAVSANDVWAVGNYNGYTLIEQWNGSNWNVIPSPSNGTNLFSVAAVSANDIWAVGSNYSATLIEQWNGSSWNVVPSPSPGSFFNELSSISVVSANDIWAVGYYEDSNYNVYTLIEQWNGSSWKVVPSPSPGSGSFGSNLSSVASVSANDVWTVGYYGDSNGYEYTLIEQWNGSSWNIVPSPSPSYPNTLSGVAAISANDIWAVGSNYSATLIEQWNGSTWNVVPSPNPAGLNAITISSVAAVSGNDVWTVGSYQDSNYNVYTLIEQWNGSRWNIVPSPSPGFFDNELLSVAAVTTNAIWSVGSIDSATLIEQWNGSSWKVVSSPNPPTVDVLGKQ